MAMKIDFTGKRALVTGAGQGIGRALALELASSGATVFALSRTQKHLDSLKLECPGMSTICCDVSDWNATREAIKKITPIHLLVNNAGVAKCAPALEALPEDFDYTFNINTKPVINTIQVMAKDLIARKLRGSVVNVSSQAGIKALKDHLIYNSSKAAMDMLTKVFALELGSNGIRVNSVNPTVTNTEMAKVGWSDPVKSKWMLDRIPQGKFAEVEDVVNAVLYLLSDASDMINGHLLPIDGGFIA